MRTCSKVHAIQSTSEIRLVSYTPFQDPDTDDGLKFTFHDTMSERCICWHQLCCVDVTVNITCMRYATGACRGLIETSCKDSLCMKDSLYMIVCTCVCTFLATGALKQLLSG